MLVAYRHVFEGMKESGIAVTNYMILEYANIFFFSFRMPLFFIISGVFIAAGLQKRGLNKYVETRARSILYPYFIWGFLQLSLQMVFTRYTNGHPTPWSYLHLFYLPREIAQFWYLYALFNVSVLYAFSKQVLKISPVNNIVIGLTFFYFSAQVYQYDLKVGFLNDIFHNYIFFAIGDLLSGALLNYKNHRVYESPKTLFALLLPFVAAQAYFLYQNTHHDISKYMFVEYYQPFMFILVALTGCAFIICLTFYLQKKNVFGWLTYMGRRSLYIYVAHVMAFAGVRIFLNKVLGVHNVMVILGTGILAALVIPLVLYHFAEKFNMRWIFTLEKQKQPQPEIPPQHIAVQSAMNKV